MPRPPLSGRASVPEARAATREARSERRPGNAGGSAGCTARGGAWGNGRETSGHDAAACGGTTARPRWTAGQRPLGPDAAARPGLGVRARGGWMPPARTASRDAPLAAPARPLQPPGARPRPPGAQQSGGALGPGARSQLPGSAASGRPATTRQQRRRLPARAGRGPWGQGAGLRSGQTSSAAPLPAPWPGRPAESGAPPAAAARSGPRVGAGSPGAPPARGNFQPPRLGPWPHAPRPCPFTSWGAVYTLRGVLVRGSGASRAGGPGASGWSCCWPHGYGGAPGGGGAGGGCSIFPGRSRRGSSAQTQVGHSLHCWHSTGVT